MESRYGRYGVHMESISKISSSFLLLANMTKFKVWMDIARRRAVASHETLRRSYLYIARNETLPYQMRQRAALALQDPNIFPPISIPTRVRDRCIETGKSRGMLYMGYSRFTFKEKVKAGTLRGWEKASW